MSLRSSQRQGKQVWRNWVLGYKKAELHFRQSGRKSVRELKRFAHKYDRQQARIELRNLHE